MGKEKKNKCENENHPNAKQCEGKDAESSGTDIRKHDLLQDPFLRTGAVLRVALRLVRQRVCAFQLVPLKTDHCRVLLSTTQSERLANTAVRRLDYGKVSRPQRTRHPPCSVGSPPSHLGPNGMSERRRLVGIFFCFWP